MKVVAESLVGLDQGVAQATTLSRPSPSSVVLLLRAGNIR